MTTEWLQGAMEVQKFGTFDTFNTKEDAEVLKGLFLGRYAHEQFVDTHTIKKMRMWDIV